MTSLLPDNIVIKNSIQRILFFKFDNTGMRSIMEDYEYYEYDEIQLPE